MGPTLGKNVGAREVRIFGRIVTFMPFGYQWEVDPKHAETIIEQGGVDKGNGAGTQRLAAFAYELEEQVDEDGKIEELTEQHIEERAAFRSNLMVASYLSLDRPDLLFGVKDGLVV